MDNKVINLDTQLEFMDESVAEAAVGKNPYFQWVKIIVTDDQPNLNKQRVPLEEFDNLATSGLFTPIKMSFNKVSGGHADAQGKVIGTVTQLIKDGNRLLAMAALWKNERPEDVNMLKEMYQKGTPPNVSWEIAYANSSIDDGGVENLFGTSLTGMAVVANPAYGGRTPFIAMSSTTEENVEELEKLNSELSELKEKLAVAETTLAEKETELTELRTFKSEIEAAQAAVEKLNAIKEKFASANVKKDETYFEENKEMLLGLSESALDFMLQELSAFASTTEATASTKVNVPNLVPDTKKNLTPKELGQALRNLNKK